MHQIVPEQALLSSRPSGNRFMGEHQDSTEDFLVLLTEHSREIYGTILRLVLNRSDADDIFQETNLVLWREFARFTPGTNFRAWSYRIAVNQVLAWRKRRQRDRLTFSSEFLSAVSGEMETDPHTLEDRVKALAECLGKLPPHQRELVALRYGTSMEIETIAEKSRRSVQAVYKALQRIRHDLLACVRRNPIFHKND